MVVEIKTTTQITPQPPVSILNISTFCIKQIHIQRKIAPSDFNLANILHILKDLLLQ